MSQTNAVTVNVPATPWQEGAPDHWVKGVPKYLTLNDSFAVGESGEWLSLCMTQQNNGTPTFGRVVVHYVGGKV